MYIREKKIRQSKHKLSEEDEVFAQITIQRGRVIDAVVVYRALIEGQWRTVLRYDCSHGFFHKDIFYEKKNRKEEVFLELDGKNIRGMIDSIAENYPEYRGLFIRNRVKK